MNPGLRSWCGGWSAIKKRDSLSRAKAFSAVPVRNEVVTEEEVPDGTVLLTLPRRDTLLVRILLKIFLIPREKKVSLDEVGSWVWRKCDGETSVGDMVKQMAEEFRLSHKEAEISLMSFLKSLSNKKIIGFAVGLEGSVGRSADPLP